jgi:hypothetical protein
MKQLLVGVLISTLFNFVYFLVVTTFHDDEIKAQARKYEKLEIRQGNLEKYFDMFMFQPQEVINANTEMTEQKAFEIQSAIKERAFGESKNYDMMGIGSMGAVVK